MSLIYGVDSKSPANTKLTNGYTLYDWVMRKSCFPTFWGRSITGKGKITPQEIAFLKSKKCKIACILRDFDEVSISGYDGSSDAYIAIKVAKSLGIPKNKGIALFAEIPADWSVNHNWMIDFSYALLNNGYIPGYIGNTDSSKNFNFDRQYSHYLQAVGGNSTLKTLIWSTEPKYKFEPDIWVPFAPSHMLPKDIDIWQFGTVGYHNISVNKNYIKDKSIINYLF